MSTRLLLIWICSCFCVLLNAQGELHVISKKQHKEFAYKASYEVNIDGERAEVYIEPTLSNKIDVDVEIIAKHPKRDQAQKDVEKMKIVSKRLKNKIFIRNYLDLGENEKKPESQLKVIYRIYVPTACPVYIKNTYGLAQVNELSNSVKVNSKFSTVNLSNLTGSLDLMTRYGDIIGESIDGNVSIGSRRTNITLKNIQGTFDIDAEYGLIQIYASTGLLDLNLDADKSQVFLYNSDLQDFRYNLTTVSSGINFPDELAFKLQQPEENIQKYQFTPTKEFFPSITVKVTFGSLQINKTPKAKRP